MHDITKQLIETTIGMKRMQIRDIEQLASSTPDERADGERRISKLKQDITQLTQDLSR